MDALLLTKAIAALVLPPGGPLLLLAAGVALRPWRPRLGLVLVVASAAVLYALSASPLSGALVSSLEDLPPVRIDDPRLATMEAIVVLGGGRRSHAPEYGGETVSALTLERVRFGARLHRASGLPVAVTGGVVSGSGAPEAELMARALREDFSVPVRWVERESRNTEQNAAFTRRLLERDAVIRIVLVSHAIHLPRATRMFRDEGFHVLPAPTAWFGGPGTSSTLRDWIPSSDALNDSRMALHEHLGRLWYRLRRGE